MPLKILNLEGFLAPISAPHQPLPSLVHSTKGTNLYSLLNARVIEARTCSVFRGEKLAYFFVGRPAYKAKDLAVSDYWLTPVVFIFSAPFPIAPKRIFPFDSGAFAGKRFGEEFRDFELGRFELSGAYSTIGKIIQVFYGSISKYRRGAAKPRTAIQETYAIGPSGFSILALSSLISKQPTDEADDRNCVIEVQFDSDIPIQAPLLKGVILAEEWLSDPALKEELESLDCTIKTYPIYPVRRGAYYSKIYELCEEIG